MMNAQEMLLDYAKTNNTYKSLTDQQFIGKAATEGVRIYRNSQEIIVRLHRAGKTITVTETTRTETVSGKTEETVEVMQVNL